MKLGVDGGGEFLKICLLVQSITNLVRDRGTNRPMYDEGIATKRFKDSAVKKLFSSELAPCVQENYDNISQLWYALNSSTFEGMIATDLKLANILAGIMTRGSVYPCAWCEAFA